MFIVDSKSLEPDSGLEKLSVLGHKVIAKSGHSFPGFIMVHHLADDREGSGDDTAKYGIRM